MQAFFFLILLNYLDKLALGRSREIELYDITRWSKMSVKSSFSSRKPQFNIFCVAVIENRCPIRHRKKCHLSGINAAQKKLNCRIYGRQMMPEKHKWLAFSML